MVCRDKFHIPRDKAKFKDAHGIEHPKWAEPFFRQEFKSFDEFFKNESGDGKALTSKEIFDKFVEPQAKCQNDCYTEMLKGAQTKDKKKLKKVAKQYNKCKLVCYKMELSRIDPEWVQKNE